MKNKATFGSDTLTQKLAALAMGQLPRWFDHVDCAELEDFALKYATKTWIGVSPLGTSQTCIIVSYPRPDGRVKMYDRDAGEFFWVKLSRLTRTRISGRATEDMYYSNAVCMDELRCESEQMSDDIDWESLREYDKKRGKISYGMFSKRACALIALPARLRTKK